MTLKWWVLYQQGVFFSFRTLKIYVRWKAHPKGCMVEGYVLNEAFFFLCEFLSKDYEDGPWIWDEAHATDIIEGEKTQSNGVQVEFGE